MKLWISRIMAKMFLVILFFCIFIFYEPLFSEENNGPLGLAEFVKRVREHGSFREILIQELTLEYNKTLSVDDIRLLLEGNLEYSVDLEGGNAGGFEGDISLSQQVPATGTSASAGWETGISLSGARSSSFLFKIEQNILNNAFGSTARLREEIADSEMAVARYQIMESYEDYLTQIIKLYIQWYAAYEHLSYAKKSLQETVALRDLITQKQRYGVAKQIDAAKSQLVVISREEQLLNAQNSYDKTHGQIARMLGLDPAALKRIPAALKFEMQIPDSRATVEKFLAGSRTAMMLSLLVQIGRQELDVSVDSLLPTAALYATYGIDGDDYFPVENLSNSLKFGLSVSVPIIDADQRARAELQRIATDKAVFHMANQRESLGMQCANLLAEFAGQIKELEFAEQKVILARQILQETERQYNLGNSGLDDLIAARNSLDSIEQARLSVIINMSGNYMEILRFTDQLLDEKKEITDSNLAGPQ
ncbi:MAG: TolC family protein [Spirochaetaceae bacterium]|nr:MAG: TolC family protein [Spirochaetaceae bacterium]